MSDARLEQEAVSTGEQVLALLRLTRQNEPAARLGQALAYSRHAPVCLVVAGERGSGRRSLVNALVGRPDLLPVGTRDTTDTCWMVRYGEQELTTAWDAWETSQAGAAQAKSVSVASPLLARGLTVIDTPGIGGPADLAAMADLRPPAPPCRAPGGRRHRRRAHRGRERQRGGLS